MVNHDLTLRKARSRDVGPMARLARAEIERGLGWTWKPFRVAATLRRRDTLGVVAVRKGVAIGFAIAAYGFERAHILLLGVTRNARRVGAGRALVEWHTRCARVAGLERIELELRATNVAARRLYESCGFVVDDVVRRYYQGREDALRMHRDLLV